MDENLHRFVFNVVPCAGHLALAIALAPEKHERDGRNDDSAFNGFCNRAQFQRSSSS
ncbi:hypothetical protein [Pseudomonas fluorescens]|uniref:hypothetical protein n=1 Tax=Pseudomonas fluorescens TaxID=294 RepID=UPI00177DE0EC|nr:hypothetical protein [Pseudomonas fluorescens]